MSDSISFTNNNEIQEKVEMILRQTDYTEEEAKKKLKEFNYDHIQVVKSYLGITEKKEPCIKSVNQEIYKQIRHKLDSNMREYNLRKERDETKI
jgi:ATP-dependent Lon protease